MRPEIAAVGNSRILIGAPFAEWYSATSIATPGGDVGPQFVGDSTSPRLAGVMNPFSARSTAIASPFGRRMMDYASAVTVGDKSVVLMWGTRRDTSRMYLGNADTLYSAALTRAGWTPMRIAAKGAVFSWDPRATSALVANGGTWIAATSAFDNDARPPWMGLVIIRGDNEAIRLDEDSRPQYLIMAGDGSRRLVLVYAVTVKTADGNVYGFTWRESRDNGGTWTPHAFIRPAGSGEDWPRLVWQDDGPHLVWLQRPPTFEGPTAVRHLRLVAGTWRDLPSLMLARRASSFSVARLRRGFAVVAQFPDGRVESVDWRDGHWSDVTTIPLPETIGAGLFELQRDTLVVLGLTGRVSPDNPPRGGILIVASVRPSRCN